MSRTLINAIRQPIWTFDDDGSVMHVNRAWLEFTGLAEVDALGDGWERAVHPDDVGPINAQWEASAPTRSAYELTYRLRQSDGAYRWHRAQVAPIEGGVGVDRWIGMAIDVHDRRLAEQELHATEQRYRDVIDHAADMVYTINIEGTVLSVNRAVEAVLGYDPEDFVGTSIAGVIAPEHIDHSRSMLDRKRAGDGRSTYEIDAIHKDGHLVTLEINNRLVESGGETVIHGIARDVSRRRERTREVELVASIGSALTERRPLDEQLSRCTQAIVDQLDAAFARIWVIDDDDPGMLALRASSGMYTHLDGQHGRIAVGTYKIGRIAAARQPHLSNTVVNDPEVHDQAWVRREGMVAFAGYPLHVGDRVVGVLGLFARHPLAESTLALLSSVADAISVGIDRARVEQAQQRALERAEVAETRYRRLFEGVADAILVTGSDQRITDANAAASSMLGYTHEELLAIDIGELIDERQHLSDDEIEEFAATGHWQTRIRLRRKDGTTVPVEVSATEVVLPDGLVYISVIRDISERSRLEHLQRDFLAMVTHDLRSPLTALKGQAQLLRRRMPEDARTSSSLESMLDQVGRMEHLIDDLADVVRLESGELQLRPQRMDLLDLVEHEIALAREHPGACTFRLESEPERLVGTWDRQRLGQVLQNLLSNAVKYSPEGGEIIVRLEEDGDDALIRVIDHGMGIPAENLPLLFQRFYRVEATGAGGLGLGLYITQMLVDVHGGEITATSVPGEGSEFRVRLPKTAEPRLARGLLNMR